MAWFGIRINTYANSRCAFASLAGKPYPIYAIPLQAGISIGTLLMCVELAIMLSILLFVPGEFAGPCFIGFAIGESLGAAALRIAGGIFTKIADIGADLMKIVFKIEEDDARNPGVIADCTGDNAGDSVGPTADGFETYGVTGVALIVFILLAVHDPVVQVQLLVWIFAMRVMMVDDQHRLLRDQPGRWPAANMLDADQMDFEQPLTTLVWLTSLISVAMTYAVSYLLIHDLGDGTMWWKLSTIITCGTLAGAIIPECVKVFTSTSSGHVKEIVTSSREGGASLNILSGFIAGNFSAYWMGLAIVGLMAIGYGVSQYGLDQLMLAPVGVRLRLGRLRLFGHGTGDHRRRFLRPGRRQRPVDLRALDDPADCRTSRAEIKRDYGFTPNFEKGQALSGRQRRGGQHLQGDRQAGADRHGRRRRDDPHLLDHLHAHRGPHQRHREPLVAPCRRSCWGWSPAAPSSIGSPAPRRRRCSPALIGPSSSSRPTSTSAARRPRPRSRTANASWRFARRYAQRGMFNIFLAVFFTTLAFACLDSYFFIGYLISIAIFGLYQAIFMANAGGAWDNAKKIVEVELREKGTPLHDASVVGDTVGDPFKDTSSVAMNPIIKFTTLFGLLAVELAIQIPDERVWVGVGLFMISLIFVWRSFYRMRITAAA